MNPAGNRHLFDTEEVQASPGEFRDFSDPKDESFAVAMGTGTPSFNPYRHGRSGAIIAGGSTYFIDAGEGVSRALAKATARAVGLLAG